MFRWLRCIHTNEVYDIELRCWVITRCLRLRWSGKHIHAYSVRKP
jgi:hypothetical protein